MQSKNLKPGVTGSKLAAFWSLTIFAVAITLSGAVFSVYSILNNVSFKVMSSSVPGFVFGVVVVFLGVRYILSMRKLSKELFKATSVFSWSNFKRQPKAAKAK